MLIRKVNTVDVSPKKKGQEKDNSPFYADPESQHSQRVAKKKDKKKTTTRPFTLIRKVNTVDGLPKKRTRKKGKGALWGLSCLICCYMILYFWRENHDPL